MKNAFAILFSLLLFSSQLWAQTLELYHAESKKTIDIRPGQAVALTYKGYNGQLEFIKQTVTGITDSTLILGVDYEKLGINSAKKGPMVNYHKTIKLDDIIGFRRMTIGRQLLKSGLRIGSVFGNFYAFYMFSNNSNYSAANVYFISLGTVFGSAILISWLLPENIKYEIRDGWTYRVIDK